MRNKKIKYIIFSIYKKYSLQFRNTFGKKKNIYLGYQDCAKRTYHYIYTDKHKYLTINTH